MFICSRYFATVRRAIWMPSLSSIVTSWLSLTGFNGASDSITLRIRACTARAEVAGPDDSPTPPEKNILADKPRGA
jgi:hypothetical protein